MKNRENYHSVRTYFRGLIFATVLAHPATQSATIVDKQQPHKQFTFSWQFQDSDQMKPRGGTTSGAAVKLVNSPRVSWKNLTRFKGPKFNKDRLAILSLAGNYRVTFDFIETIVSDIHTNPVRPYQSWATEYIFVLENKPHFISLQHILVMTFVDDSDKESETMVMKHWRQDWAYEDSDLLTYNLQQRWNQKNTSMSNSGLWSQSVFQVDDSPRYAALGKWEHRNGFSTWTSQDTLRPLPRRESSVRSDYQALWGTNRITVQPSGWVHEEDNLKMVIEHPSGLEEEQTFKAREAGIARYESIAGLETTPAEKYWKRTKLFWRDVRTAWSTLARKNNRFGIQKKVDNRSLVSVMFEYAQALSDEDDYDPADSKAFITKTLERYSF